MYLDTSIATKPLPAPAPRAPRRHDADEIIRAATAARAVAKAQLARTPHGASCPCIECQPAPRIARVLAELRDGTDERAGRRVACLLVTLCWKKGRARVQRNVFAVSEDSAMRSVRRSCPDVHGLEVVHVERHRAPSHMVIGMKRGGK